MNKKPVIGLSSSRMRLEGGYLTGIQKTLVNSDYVNAVLRGGGLPFVLPLVSKEEEIRQYLGLCDGVLLTGRMDVDLILYEEWPHPKCGSFDLEADRANLAPAREAIRMNKLLGICRGMQLINVVFGGTLYQDIPSQCLDCGGHSYGCIGSDVVYTVCLEQDSPFPKIFGGLELAVHPSSGGQKAGGECENRRTGAEKSGCIRGRFRRGSRKD